MINRVIMAENDFLGMDSSMKGPFLTSTIFHILLFIITIVGIPFVARDHEIISHPISVELVNVEEITQTNRPMAPAKKTEEKKEEPKPKQEKPAPPQMREQAPPDLTKPKPPEVKKEEEVKPPPPEALAPPDKKPEPKKKEKPPEKKPEATKVEKPTQQQDFNSLLKNLTPDKPEEGDKAALDPTADASPQESQIAQLSDRLSVSEIDALRRQLSQCWSVLAGAAYAEELIVEVRVVVNRDRTVQQATIVDMGRYNRDTSFRSAGDAALRALRNPRCTPLALPPDKYNEWKTTVIRFDPSEML